VNLLIKALLYGIAEMAVFGAVLFISAGTMNWLGAWAFLAIMFGLMAVVSAMLVRHDPDLLKERLRSPVQRGQKGWDQLLMAVFMVVFIAWLPLMAFDAVRYQWSYMPAWLQWVGGAGLIASSYFCYLTFRENAYLVNVVRIQKERGQHVVSTGPYRFVRHPLYASMLVFLPSIALLLGSWWGVVWAIAMIGLLVVRTVLEDATLVKELDGYADYSTKIRYRLLPGVW
jgi:protein-S-isoprenylcysteine O-methyltransferase Ste14